ncbi:MAG: NAD-dependent DNA ligase LigA [Saprospiraceae bacterium]
MYSDTEQKELVDLSKQLIEMELGEDFGVLEMQSKQLADVIRYHEWRYYILNDPSVSDYEFDQLYKKLEAIETLFPELLAEDSPTRRVSQDLSSDAIAIQHKTPMLSLANSYDAADLEEFDAQIKKITGETGDIDYCVEPKFDGGTIVLLYENDKLVRGATRGDGVQGEEMTENAKFIKGIPHKAAFSKQGIQSAELRGEALIRKDVFGKLNDKRAEEGLPLFANPRNAATGGLRMKDPQDTEKRKLDAFVYQMGYAVNADGGQMISKFKTHDASIRVLGELGFNIPGDAHKVCKGIQEVSDFCLEWQEKRESYPYEIDGMVVKVNRLDLQQKCGSTSHHPRWAIAFKFKAKQASSKLLQVDFQVGKVGAVTPIAKIEPVPLAGVTISSISLHNEKFIQSKDIRIGDQVLVERAGDVIPYIVKSMPELRDGSERPIVFPTLCPSCQSVLVKPVDEAIWRCENHACPAQVLQRMIHHASKDAMDIEGMGGSTIIRFHELGLIHTIADLYRLDYGAIEELPGFGQRSADKLRSSVESAKKQPINRLLYSLSIHHLGQKASKILAGAVDNVLDLKDWSFERYTELKDIGPTVASNMTHFFEKPGNVELLETLEHFGVNMKQSAEDKPRTISADSPFGGKTILFTGTLEKMNRNEAEAKAEAAGAILLTAVSKNLNILVVGAKAGSKLSKAQSLGTVEILTEDQFIEKIG